jgi:hypothetical protein
MFISRCGGLYLRLINFRLLCYSVIHSGFVHGHRCNSYTEFHETPTNSLVDNTRSQTDGRVEERNWSPLEAFSFYFVKNA